MLEKCGPFLLMKKPLREKFTLTNAFCGFEMLTMENASLLHRTNYFVSYYIRKLLINDKRFSV